MDWARPLHNMAGDGEIFQRWADWSSLTVWGEESNSSAETSANGAFVPQRRGWRVQRWERGWGAEPWPDFAEFGQHKTSPELLPPKPRLCCSTAAETELLAALTRGCHGKFTSPALTSCYTKSKGRYKTGQLENRPKLQISAAEIGTQIVVLSFPALSSSLQAWKGATPGKKMDPNPVFYKDNTGNSMSRLTKLSIGPDTGKYQVSSPNRRLIWKRNFLFKGRRKRNKAAASPFILEPTQKK